MQYGNNFYPLQSQMSFCTSQASQSQNFYENYFDDELQQKSKQVIQKGVDCANIKDFRRTISVIINQQQQQQDPLLFFLSLLILMLAFVLFVFFVFYSREQQTKVL